MSAKRTPDRSESVAARLQRLGYQSSSRVEDAASILIGSAPTTQRGSTPETEGTTVNPPSGGPTQGQSKQPLHARDSSRKSFRHALAPSTVTTADGRQLWTISCRHGGSVMVPKYHVGLHFFVGGIERSILALDAAKGRESSQPLVSNEGTTSVRPSSSVSLSIEHSDMFAASSGSGLQRIVFAVVENPSAQNKAPEDRRAAWAALRSLSRVHLLASRQTFGELFSPFHSSTSSNADTASPVNNESSAQRSGTGGAGLDSSAARMVTRSAALGTLGAIFPVFDQSLEPPPTPPTSNAPAVTPPPSTSPGVRVAKCYTNDGSLWCPVMKLRPLSALASAAGITKLPEELQSGSGGGVVLALEPMQTRLKEDVTYVSQLPIMSELHDRFAVKRQAMVDEWENEMASLRREAAMLRKELSWAHETLSSQREKEFERSQFLEKELCELQRHIAAAELLFPPNHSTKSATWAKAGNASSPSPWIGSAIASGQGRPAKGGPKHAPLPGGTLGHQICSPIRQWSWHSDVMDAAGVGVVVESKDVVKPSDLYIRSAFATHKVAQDWLLHDRSLLSVVGLNVDEEPSNSTVGVRPLS